MTTDTTLVPLEDVVRADLDSTQAELADLRAERKAVDAKVRRLVAQEKTLKRIVAVYDRANAKSA